MDKLTTIISRLFAATTIVLFAVSCSKDSLDITKARIIGVERTLNATAAMPQGGDKAYFDESDDRKVKWELTDFLNINGTNIALAELSADPTMAKFYGITYAIPTGGNDIYWAVYPATMAGAASGSSIPSNFTASTLTVNFPSTQTYDASANALSGNTLMAGYVSVPTGDDQIMFQMRNLGAVLKLNLKADASAANKLASKIEFSTTNGALAGEFTVSSNTTVSPAATATKTLTVNLTDGTNNYIDLSSAKDIYVILPPMAAKKLTMTVYNVENKQTNKTIASATFARNNIYTNTVSDLCFCECGGGSPYFSVSATRKVVFAPGNLQWSATNGGGTPTTHVTADGLGGAGTWRFAASQWDYIGNAPGNTTAAANRATQAYWIDLFGWGTSGYDNTANDRYAINFQPWAISLSVVNTTYNNNGYGPSINMTDTNLTGTSANYDWGVYNAIFNPKTGTTDPAGTWRTPTAEEWDYVLNTRTTCSGGIHYAKATVNGVQGLIILPDNWDTNNYALNNTDQQGATYGVNIITATQWNDIFEPAGCAFFPAAGHTNGNRVDQPNYGYYWSTTCYRSIRAYSLLFNGTASVRLSTDNRRSYGRSVRLVKDI